MNLERINYSDLNSRQKEVYNFQKVAAQLAEFGFNCIRLSDDWQGADFLAYHKDGMNTLRVQLKSRVYIGKKYLGKSLWLTFPVNEDWYLVEHDRLVQMAEKHTTWLTSESWRERGGYSSAHPNPGLLGALQRYRLA